MVGHVYPYHFTSVLEKDSGARVLEEDVVVGVTLVKLVPDLPVQIVVGVLGFPQAPRHAQGVPDCAVGFVAAVCPQFRYEHQPLGLLGTVGCQAVLECRADVFFVVGTAELDQFGKFAVITFNVGVVRHGNQSGSRSSEQSRQHRLDVVGTHSNNGAREVPNRLLKRLKCRNEIRRGVDRFQPTLNQIPSSEIASDGDVDLLREALRVLADGIMDAEVSAQIGAQHGERNPERVTYRNRTWDTRVGTMELHIPKLREGSYLPSLLEPRRRSEQALLAVIQQANVEGVSTRRVDDLIKALGCDGISNSQVSRICEQLDEVVESFLGRPLDSGPYAYVWLDGLTQQVREGGRIVNVCVVVARGSMPKGSVKSWVWTWAPARTARSGCPSCGR